MASGVEHFGLVCASGIGDQLKRFSSLSSSRVNRQSFSSGDLRKPLSTNTVSQMNWTVLWSIIRHSASTATSPAFSAHVAAAGKLNLSSAFNTLADHVVHAAWFTDDGGSSFISARGILFAD